MAKPKNRYNNERGEKGGYVALYHCVLRSNAIAALSAHASKLLMDFLSQYIGNNNGDFCATYSIMQKRGWRSKGTLDRAIKELLEAGIIEVSRQGGRHLCSLYAVTFYAVDDCKGKLEINATSTPKSLWRKNEPVPDIRVLQKQKQAKDDARLVSEIMDRQKRASSN